ncbi:MAG TPA: methyltransferase domain-containing protein [Thermomicrobiales bacterium]
MTETDTQTETPNYYRRRRTIARHLHGDGIEVGALHFPLDLSEAHVTRIRYVDRFDVPGLREQYPTMADLSFVPVDIVDNGEVLSTIPNGSLDFVIANSMIEHTSDPIGTLRHWLEKLRPGGMVYFTMPDKRVGWDVNRPITSIAHLLEDYQSDAVERRRRDRAHFVEFHDLWNQELVTASEKGGSATGISNPPSDEQRLAAIDHMIEVDYSIHYHVFTHHTFVALLDYLRRVLHFPFTIIERAPPLAESWESVFVLKRTDAPIPPVRARVDEPPPEIATDVAMPPAEEETVTAARLTVRLLAAETRVWEANTRAWEAAVCASNAESALNARLSEQATRLRWLEEDVIPAKNADLAAYAVIAARIETLPPVRAARRVQQVTGRLGALLVRASRLG